MTRQIDDPSFDRAISLSEAIGRLINQAAAANLPEVQNAVNGLVQSMTAYAVELIAPPADASVVTDNPETPE